MPAPLERTKGLKVFLKQILYGSLNLRDCFMLLDFLILCIDWLELDVSASCLSLKVVKTQPTSLIN